MPTRYRWVKKFLDSEFVLFPVAIKKIEKAGNIGTGQLPGKLYPKS
jgi:hypothetical protein